MPRPGQKDRLTDAWGKHGHEHEDHEHEAHYPRHGLALEQVADHRDHEYPGRGCGGALKHSTSDQQVKGRGRGADQPENDVQANPEGKHRLSPEAVGKWAPQQLSEAEAKHVHDDDQLSAIILCDAEMRADVGERRDHRVDREGVERHQPSEHGDGLTRARARPRAGKVLQGYGHGRPRQWPSCSHVPRGGRKGRLFA